MASILRSIGHPTKVFVPQINSPWYLSQVNMTTEIKEVNLVVTPTIIPHSNATKPKRNHELKKTHVNVTNKLFLDLEGPAKLFLSCFPF